MTDFTNRKALILGGSRGIGATLVRTFAKAGADTIFTFAGSHEAAATLAAEEGIMIYAVGAGTNGRVPAPVFDAQGHRTGTEMQYTEIDPELLKELAERTGGQSFMANDTEGVRDAFYAIDNAQTEDFGAAPPMSIVELFPAFALFGVLLLAGASWGAHFRTGRAAAWT